MPSFFGLHVDLLLSSSSEPNKLAIFIISYIVYLILFVENKFFFFGTYFMATLHAYAYVADGVSRPCWIVVWKSLRRLKRLQGSLKITEHGYMTLPTCNCLVFVPRPLNSFWYAYVIYRLCQNQLQVVAMMRLMQRHLLTSLNNR